MSAPASASAPAPFTGPTETEDPFVVASPVSSVETKGTVAVAVAEAEAEAEELAAVKGGSLPTATNDSPRSSDEEERLHTVFH